MGNPSFDVSDEIKNSVQADEFEDDTVDFNFQDLTYGQYLEKMHKKYPPFDYSRAPEPLPVTWIPRRAYIPSDSDSESEEKSEKDSKRAQEVEYEEEEEKIYESLEREHLPEDFSVLKKFADKVAPVFKNVANFFGGRISRPSVSKRPELTRDTIG